jgi:hypothetical protein
MLELSRDEGVSVDELEKVGFTVNTGAANVAAAPAKPTAPVYEQDAALTAAAALLFKKGRQATATKAGRAKRVLGDRDGISPYRVIVTKA